MIAFERNLTKTCNNQGEYGPEQGAQRQLVDSLFSELVMAVLGKP